MEVEVTEPKSTPAPRSTLAFCPEGPFLAAGGMDSRSSELLVLRSTPGAGLFGLVGSFLSPAPFSRVCWSDASASGYSRSPAGLIAGGLDNGSVVVWDPKNKIRDWSVSTYDEGERELKQKLEGEDFVTRGFNFKMIDNYIGSDVGRESPPKLCLDHRTTNQTLCLGRLAVVASFAPSSPTLCSPVRGLAFCPCSSALLASGSEDGQILVRDIANRSAQSVPTFQHNSNPSVQISCLAWSKFVPNILAYTSLGGTTSVLNLSSRAPIVSCECMRHCSSVDFSPVNENLLLVSCADAVESTSLMEWDIRKMTEPIIKFCEDSEGVNALSWSSWNDLIVTTNNNKVIVWDMYEKKVIAEKKTPSRCFDIKWNKTSEKSFFSEWTSSRSFIVASDEHLHMYEVDFPHII